MRDRKPHQKLVQCFDDFFGTAPGMQGWLFLKNFRAQTLGERMSGKHCYLTTMSYLSDSHRQAWIMYWKAWSVR
jgi:hypothetical protein